MIDPPVFKLIRDDKGYVIRCVLEEPSLEQSSIDLEDFLEHHGVKGMKWGVRRKRTGTGTSKSTKKVDISKLSDDELRALVSRMQLEQQFKNVSKSSKTKAGKQFATSILSNVARTTLTGLGTAAAGKAVGKILK